MRLYGKISIDKLYFNQNSLIELSSLLNGSSIIAYNNEHFGKAENILAPGRAFNMGDGWETRRRRTKGYDWIIFKFGIPGYISDINIDTSHFKGNYPDKFSIQGSYIQENKNISKTKIINDSTNWKYIINNEKLFPDKEHLYNDLIISRKINYIKLNIFPDGGIARLKLNGKVDLEKINLKGKNVNLSLISNGSTIVGCNNEHFGKAENVLSPGVGVNMGDGWETRRSRGKNFDWIIIKFGMPGIINKLEIDTHHFKGNYPESLTVQSALITNKN